MIGPSVVGGGRKEARVLYSHFEWVVTLLDGITPRGPSFFGLPRLPLSDQRTHEIKLRNPRSLVQPEL
jgi:hypothetical protein